MQVHDTGKINAYTANISVTLDNKKSLYGKRKEEAGVKRPAAKHPPVCFGFNVIICQRVYPWFRSQKSTSHYLK